MYADLHLHSVYSDGTDTQDELISLAIENGIKVISITEHDSISAYSNISNIRAPDITIIPAIEISTVLEHSYLHMLGYYIDTNSAELADYIKKVSAEKTENTRINFENAINEGCFHYA
jgi:predicted metal-dependent phosphoesterase TrpH